MSENKLEIIVRESGLEETKAQDMLNQFQDYFAIAAEWETKAKVIAVTSEDQTADMAMARVGRLFLRDKRIAIEKTRKTMKEQSLREGKAIDGIANILKALIIPVEKYLDEQEHFVEIRDAKIAEEERVAEERRVEEARIAAEEAERKEQERIRKENERLHKEAIKKEAALKAERERVEAERIEAENKRIEAERKIQKENEAAMAAEKAKAEKARIASEKKAAAERKVVEDKARKEREVIEDKARKEHAIQEAALKAALEEVEAAESKRLIEVTCPHCGGTFTLE